MPTNSPGWHGATAWPIRYRPATATHPYSVAHSSAVYVFDRAGDARLLVPSLASTQPDLAGTAADLERLLHPGAGGLLARLGRLF